MKRHSWLAVLALLVTPFASEAQITVSRSVIELSGQERVQDVEVRNNGTNKIYLDLQLAEIVNPDSDQPLRRPINDPRTAPVLVSPRQLMVPPGTRKRMRVILREPPTDKDRVFRLAVKPYTGKARLARPGGDKKASAIRVLVGYDLLLLARPEGLDPEIRVTRDERSIEFRNTGNTNVLLRRIVQCEAGTEPDDSAADTNCTEIQPNRLYAGETYRVRLPRPGAPDETPVRVWQAVGLENSSNRF